MNVNELLGLATPRGGAHNDDHDDEAEEAAMDDGSLQVRTMEVPRWLSTTDVTGEFSIIEYLPCPTVFACACRSSAWI
jgi:hypothetical protein